MNTNIEVEIRSFISPKQYQNLIALFKRDAEFLSEDYAELNIPLTPKAEFKQKYDHYQQHWRELI